MLVDRHPFPWLILACYSIFITYISLLPGQGNGDITDLKQYKIPHLDKVLHVGAYWVYALLALFAAKMKYERWLVCCLLLLHGILLEYLQITLATGREASIPDIIANTAGVILGYFTALIYQHHPSNPHH
ncbi:VanZ family protein [Photobacterium chitinilyticum]|uniref:VanZ-like domain-containing protein n=1 Tax=Photobacterium chitinilyticum TaxID=2485123 RepID=A0A3S3UKI5_9GAMM|nr:VanZ family protein [Photobacterium chitinilyticum]RWX56091.1 hypothetical protein EDI28_07315 [Photobacterium chitinilyticum]